MGALDDGERYQVVEDLVTQDPDHLERLLGSDRVDEHVAMDADEVFRVQYRVFILKQGHAAMAASMSAGAGRSLQEAALL